MKRIKVILRKELLDTVRDHRTLLVMIVVPLLLMPLAIVGLGKFSESQEKSLAKERVKVSINYLDSQIKQAFNKDKTLVLKLSKNPLADLKKKKVQAALIVDKNFREKIGNNKIADLKVWANEADPSSASANQKIILALNGLSQSISTQRLAKLRVGQEIINPLSIQNGNVASRQEMGGQFLSFIIPMMIVMWALIGGMYTAIDLSAGEKERKTLEALLFTPAARLEIVIGKFLTVLIVSLTTVFIAIVSIFFSLKLFPVKMFGLSSGSLNFLLSFKSLITLASLSILVAAMFSAVMLTLCIFARSFKEGQNYLTPLYTVAMIPMVVISIMPKLSVKWPLLLVPAVNVVVVLKELFIGQFNWLHFTIALGASLIYALLALILATYFYNQESVIFRQ